MDTGKNKELGTTMAALTVSLLEPVHPSNRLRIQNPESHDTRGHQVWKQLVGIQSPVTCRVPPHATYKIVTGNNPACKEEDSVMHDAAWEWPPPGSSLGPRPWGRGHPGS